MEELYRTCQDDPEPMEADVTGTLPEWLGGTLYRNGPGKFEFGDTKYNHWFDGAAILRSFQIQEGKVTYRSRFLSTDTFRANTAANRIVVTGFGTFAHPDPCKNIFSRIFSYFFPPKSDNTLVNVYPVGDALVTATELPEIWRVHPVTLDTMEKIDAGKLLALHMLTAHPHIDSDGTVHNLGSRFGRGTQCCIVRMKPAKTIKPGDIIEHAEVAASVAAHHSGTPSYFHSFAMTENYYILIEQPLVFNALGMLIGKLIGYAFADSLQWKPENGTKFHILDKKTGRKVNENYTYVTDALMLFHHMNAYEEDGQVVVDVSSFVDYSVVNAFNLNNLTEETLKSGTAPRVSRFALPLNVEQENVNLVTLEGTTASAKRTGDEVRCEQEIMFEPGFEFPQINYKRYNGRKYRYGYGCRTTKGFLDTIVKVDLETKEELTWLEEGCYPSEPVFVPHPDEEAEDQGVILSLVLETGPGREAFLLVLDAANFKELGRANVPVQMNRDTHGYFLKS